MRLSKLIGGLAALVVLAGTVGALGTLAVEPLGLGARAFDRQQAAGATVALVVVAVLAAVVVGVRSGEWLSNPYW